MRRFFVFLVVCSTLLLLSPTAAGAHSGKQSYVYVSIFSDSMEGRVEYPVLDLATALGITDIVERAGGIDDPSATPMLSEAETRAFVDTYQEQIRAYTAEHLALGDGTTQWDLEFGDLVVLVIEPSNYVQVHYRVTQTFDTTPRSFVVTYDGIIHQNPEKDALVIIENDWDSGTFGNEANPIAGLSVGQTMQTIELGSVSTVRSMTDVGQTTLRITRLRADFIWFVIALLLPVALVAKGHAISDPAPTIRGAGRRLGGLLIAFTLGLVVPLWSIGFGVFEVSERTASIGVAAALLMMAVYGLRRAADVEPIVVAALGVLQGLGLGFVFTQLKLERSHTLLSLMAFTLGTELAIAVIVGATFPLVLWARRTSLAGPILAVGTVVMTVFALVYLYERIGETTVRLAELPYRLVVLPRALIGLVAAAAVIGAAHRLATQRNTLRPLIANEPRKQP